MNNEDELLKIAEKISNECSQISNSFYKITDKIQTMNLLTPENQKNQIIKRNEEKTIKEEILKKERRDKGVCQHCGGEFKGWLIKKCSTCGKRKDY